jgi:hypothetical protein
LTNDSAWGSVGAGPSSVAEKYDILPERVPPDVEIVNQEIRDRVANCQAAQDFVLSRDV